MKPTIKRLVAKALQELGDLEFVRVVNDPFPVSRPLKVDPFKVNHFSGIDKAIKTN